MQLLKKNAHKLGEGKPSLLQDIEKKRLTEIDFLTYLNISGNGLTGTIPENIGSSDSLKYLYLDYNFLSGEIPQSLGNLKNIRRLYLHTNQLSGIIPENICNLYENDLGPQLSFRAFFDNNNLCPGALGYPACIPGNHLGPQYCSP